MRPNTLRTSYYKCQFVWFNRKLHKNMKHLKESGVVVTKLILILLYSRRKIIMGYIFIFILYFLYFVVE